MNEKEYDAMLQITGTVKNKQVLIRITTDGETEWDQTRMLILDMVYHIAKFYHELVERTRKS